MKFKVKPADLLPELEFVAAAAEANGPHPMLAHVLFNVAASGAVQLTTTNLKVSLRTALAVATDEAADFTVEARLLTEWLKKAAKEEPATFTTGGAGKERWLQASSGKKKMKFVSLDPKIFPPIENPTSGPILTAPAGAFNALAQQTQFAVSNDDTRYVLCGALLDLLPGEVKMVTTDGNRLALASIPFEWVNPKKEKISVLVPKVVLTEVLRLSDKHEIIFAQSETSLFFVSGARSITGRKMTGTFPAYESILPGSLPIVSKVNKNELIDAIQTVHLASDGEPHLVRFDFTPAGLNLHGKSARAVAEDTVAQGSYVGPDAFSIGLSAKYVLDFLAAAKEADITIAMVDGTQAARFSSGAEYAYYVMPIHLT